VFFIGIEGIVGLDSLVEYCFYLVYSTVGWLCHVMKNKTKKNNENNKKDKQMTKKISKTTKT
jgi:hypothetical protein